MVTKSSQAMIFGGGKIERPIILRSFVMASTKRYRYTFEVVFLAEDEKTLFSERVESARQTLETMDGGVKMSSFQLMSRLLAMVDCWTKDKNLNCWTKEQLCLTFKVIYGPWHNYDKYLSIIAYMIEGSCFRDLCAGLHAVVQVEGG